MSTFKNISNGALYIQGFLRQGDGTLGVGAQVYIEPGETFDGSNYYKRFTYTGMIESGISQSMAKNEAVLSIEVDDGLPFSENLSAPNNPRVYHVEVEDETPEELDFLSDLGGSAEFMTIETDGDISVYINGNDNARIDISANSQYSFTYGELLIDSVIITNRTSGSSTSDVQVIVANSI